MANNLSESEREEAGEIAKKLAYAFRWDDVNGGMTFAVVYSILKDLAAGDDVDCEAVMRRAVLGGEKDSAPAEPREPTLRERINKLLEGAQ